MPAGIPLRLQLLGNYFLKVGEKTLTTQMEIKVENADTKRDTKSIFRSRTLWFNIITILIGTVEVISKTYPLSPEILLAINTIGNLILRLLTGTAVSLGGETFFKKTNG